MKIILTKKQTLEKITAYNVNNKQLFETMRELKDLCMCFGLSELMRVFFSNSLDSMTCAILNEKELIAKMYITVNLLDTEDLCMLDETELHILEKTYKVPEVHTLHQDILEYKKTANLLEGAV